MRSLFSFPIVLLILCCAGVEANAQTADSGWNRLPEMNEFVCFEIPPSWSNEELQQRTVYPTIARRDEAEGWVVVHALVDTNGEIVRYNVGTSGNARLDSAAVNGVLATRFAPARKEGVPVPAWVRIPILFWLTGPAPPSPTEPDPSPSSR